MILFPMLQQIIKIFNINLHLYIWMCSMFQLPDTSHLNFELSKHKRTLSKKGSIAHRKKPSRAAIKAVKESSEEDHFKDSTGEWIYQLLRHIKGNNTLVLIHSGIVNGQRMLCDAYTTVLILF